MEESIKQLRSEFNRIKDNLQEDNVRLHIIVNTFMEYYGYDVKNCVLEKPMVRDFCDVFVPTVGNNALVIEVKTGKKPLEVEDIDQARGYAAKKRQRFAILSNGYEYVLLDFNLESTPKLEGDALKSYVVFWFNIFKAKGTDLTELKYFKYLSYENLYRNQATHFYCDVAQYREWKCEQELKPVSWTAYRSTLYQFFDFYARKVLYKEPYEKVGKRAYETLNMDIFDEFIKECKRNGADTSTKTLNNNHTHIYNMLYELEKHGRIKYISLSDSRKQNLVAYEETEQRKVFTEITANDVRTILTFLKTKRNATRDIVIFLLTVTLGLERSQLLELKWDAFDRGYRHINVGERKIELCPILQRYLEKLYKQNRNKKIKTPYIFQIYYKQKYRPMREWNINDVFNNFAQITNDDKWKDYSPKYVRNCLIRTFFVAGYSLEDIMYITGIDIKNISKYITMNELLRRRNKRMEWKQLYDGILCEDD